MARLLAEWMDKLPLQQQAVLVLAGRGPDGFPKVHGAKPVLMYYRASIFAAAHLGRHLRAGEFAGTLMSLRGFDLDSEADLGEALYGTTSWASALRQFKQVVDELPLHFFAHLMHGSQILAYKHPETLFRTRWFEFYSLCCDCLHVPIEIPEVMDARLNDFDRDLEYIEP